MKNHAIPGAAAIGVALATFAAGLSEQQNGVPFQVPAAEQAPDDEAKPKSLRPEALQALWTDLAGDDGQKAYRAIQTLIDAPQQSVPFLRDRLQPVPAPDAKRLAALIAQLDAKDFKQREQAARQLADLGDLAGPALEAALRNRPPLELRRRLEKLLGGLPVALKAGETLRQVRAIEVLDQIGSPEAVRVLQRMAAGAPRTRPTREARVALERLAREKKGRPGKSR